MIRQRILHTSREGAYEERLAALWWQLEHKHAPAAKKETKIENSENVTRCRLAKNREST